MMGLFGNKNKEQHVENQPIKCMTSKTEHLALIKRLEGCTDHEFLDEIEKLIAEGYRVVGYTQSSYRPESVFLSK